MQNYYWSSKKNTNALNTRNRKCISWLLLFAPLKTLMILLQFVTEKLNNPPFQKTDDRVVNKLFVTKKINAMRLYILFRKSV